MSAILAPTVPARVRGGAEHPRHITAVDTGLDAAARRRARPKLGYALSAVGAIFAVLLAQLLLSIALSDGAYSLSSLSGEQRDLARVQQALTEQLELVGSTQNLAASAHALGMVGASSPAFLRLSDGRVLGRSATAAPSAGPAGANLVANFLLTGDQPVDSTAAGNGSAQPAPASTPGTTTQPAADTPPTPVSNPGDLPSPVTH